MATSVVRRTLTAPSHATTRTTALVCALAFVVAGCNPLNPLGPRPSPKPTTAAASRETNSGPDKNLRDGFVAPETRAAAAAPRATRASAPALAKPAPEPAVLEASELAGPNMEAEVLPELEPPSAQSVIAPICTEPNLPMTGVTIGDATVLAEPRELGRTVTTVPSGIQVDVVGRANQWMSIRLAGSDVVGYLHCSTLRSLTPKSATQF